MRLVRAGAAVAGICVAVSGADLAGHASDGQRASHDAAGDMSTSTPIKHLVVIFQENVSFDHYFGTYPNAANPPGQPSFVPRGDTPQVNGLSTALLSNNPNKSNPKRLDRSQAVTCDMNHEYTSEQDAFNHGAMDKFVESTTGADNNGNLLPTLGECISGKPGVGATPGDNAVMDYYDGNTVTALWEYAQHFAMSDNSFSTGFGPSTPGAFEITSGNPAGAICATSKSSGVNTTSVFNAPACKPSPYVTYKTPPTPAPGAVTAPATGTGPSTQGAGTVYGDPDPYYDTCSAPGRGDGLVAMGGKNIGDLLNASAVNWGWFQGGFSNPAYDPHDLSTFDTTKVCTGSTARITPDHASTGDYSAHHQPFEYFPQTANPTHVPPSAIASIGAQDRANHQYDIKDFFAAADGGYMPAVSFLKAVKAQDGHAGYSDPLDEQLFLVNTINHLETLPEWSSTAVVILYDDSDGWYDHAMGPVQFQSQTALDTLTGPGQCGANSQKVPAGDAGPQQARCGFGPRQPLLVISPFAKSNYVDHSITDQSSIVRLIEDNWHLGRVGSGSADVLAGSLLGMFDFTRRGEESRGTLTLDPLSGLPVDG